MKLINTKMWFSHKLEQDKEEEQIVELTQEDVLKTIDFKVPSKNIKENTQPMNELSNQIDTIVTAIKNAIGISNEVEEKPEVQEIETVEEEQTEEKLEVQETEEKTDDAQTVSEETEDVQDEQTEQPRNEDEGNEPPETETVETEEKQEEETIEETVEETVEEVVEEGQEEHQEEAGEELNALENSLEVKEEKEDSIVDKTSALLQEIETLKAEKQAKELQLEKMEFSKEVAKDYEGVPGKLEDKTEKIFEIKNSALSEDTKAFILQSLKSLSLQNVKDCQEIGHDLEVETDEKAENEVQIKNLMEKENLTENQAFLVVNGFRSLAEAKKASARVQKRK